MDLKRYDIVLLLADDEWRGCLAVVDEVKSFGMQGFVQIPFKGQAWIRKNSEDFVVVGSLAGYIQDPVENGQD